jgi:hypothetical protein
MLKVYIIVFPSTVEQATIKDFLDKQPSIAFWFYNMASSIFVKTTLSADKIHELLETTLNGEQVFITEVAKENYSGRLPTEHWVYFFETQNITPTATE